MSEVVIPIEVLSDAARDFSKAGKSIIDIKLKLKKRMNSLEKPWSDSTKQRFFQYYRELDQQLGACNQMLSTISREMQAIAERYAELNKE